MTNERSTRTPRGLWRRLLPVAVTAAGALVASSAAAQVDIEPPLPNVLLLVDTSGSMELMPDGSAPTSCNPESASDLNRWTALVEVLTGTVENRGCYRLNRSSQLFRDIYSISGIDPYDRNYHLPHHRIVSNGCTINPGTLPADIYGWPADALRSIRYDSASTACTGFNQSNDGLLDAYRDRVRFGLMTFDPMPHPGGGVTLGSVDVANGFSGMWSYYPNWNSGGTPASGHPPACEVSVHEVGARNNAAPPWEGRLISPGPSDATLSDIRDINERIQLALLAMRPYGATPLDGMLADAYAFLRDDKSSDPLNPSQPFAPAGDPMAYGGCRKSFVIVLSDGEPNLDLRPYCEEVGGSCPFEQAHEVARKLAQPSDPALAVPVFAVGFGLSSAAGVDCRTLEMPNDFNAGGLCDGATGALRACCTMARIAYEGGTENAFFADDITSLKEALAQVLSEISAGSTSRTVPVFAATSTATPVQGGAEAVAYQFTSSFNTSATNLWTGNLERNRWVCKAKDGELLPELQPVARNLGDDFAHNINVGKNNIPRTFYTVRPDLYETTKMDPEATIRPHSSGDPDGLGEYGGALVGGVLQDMVNAASAMPQAFGLAPMPAFCTSENLQASTSSECAGKLMRWLLGGVNGPGLPTRDGNEFGAIYHGIPALVGPPSARLRDEDYQAFALKNAHRPIMLYTVTTDGQIHAHKVASLDPNETGVKADRGEENNELWSFIPPFVLSNLPGIYPNVQNALLDGTPVVRDVIYERSLAQAKAAGTESGADWHTVMVVNGGLAGGYFVALDVTTPESPRFLWQIADIRKSALDPFDGNKSDPSVGKGLRKATTLFGDVTPPAAIASIALADGPQVKETAVAILGGGTGRLASSDACSPKAPNQGQVQGSYTPGNDIRCWEDGPSQSLWVVRLSDGEVLRVFTPKDRLAGGLTKLDPALLIDSPFASPISGTPVAYPNAPGQVADRIYVGDADGILWRIDLSSPDPNEWEAHVAFDAYPLTSDSPAERQPVMGHPVLALDGEGNTVLLYATGDQEWFGASTGMKTRLWSIIETPVTVSGIPFTMKANWLLDFVDGKRVTGPVAVFDNVAYFATYTPAATAACDSGYGSIWGVHFKDSTAGLLGPTPLPRLVENPDSPTLTYVDELKQDPGTVVYGVSVTMEPPCFDTTTGDDDYVGTHTSITSSTPPRFSLVYHTGSRGSSFNAGATSRATTQRLPQPTNQLRVDSWASVTE